VASKLWANWKIPLLSITLMISAATNALGAPSGATLYAKKCAPCHGRTGNGDGPSGVLLRPPPQPFSTALKGKSDSWLDTVISKGGPAVGLSPMMPAQPMLDATQVKDLIQYIKGFGLSDAGYSSSNL
jgi:mono/diheme cytochrome c family protein